MWAAFVRYRLIWSKKRISIFSKVPQRAGFQVRLSVIILSLTKIWHMISRCELLTLARWTQRRKFWQTHTLPDTTLYRYELSILPTTHGQDLYYYFYDGFIAAAAPETIGPVVQKFQRYLRRFILGQDMEDWPEYGSTGLATPVWINMTDDSLTAASGGVEADRAKRCPSILGLFSNLDDSW